MILQLLMVGILVGFSSWAQAGDQVWDSITPGCKMFQHDGRVELVCDGDDPIPLKESICYQKMREAMQKMKAQIHPNPNSRSLSRGFSVTEEIWDKEFESLYQECLR